MIEYDELIDIAREAREYAYAPYSEFQVGVALLCKDGTVYTGSNIENINYTNTIHAEQLAVHKAVHDGHRDFDALAMSCSGEPSAPCGLCRQTLSEFCDDDLAIIVEDLDAFTLGELLPGAMENID